jgi:O-antigen ligase
MVFVVFRFILSFGNGPAIDWVRDAVPFLYGFLAFMSARSLATSSAMTRARTIRVFWWAILFHLVWTATMVFSGAFQGIAVPGPLFTVPFFQVRPDIDSALVAVAVGMLLRNVILGRRRIWSFLGIALGLGTVLSLGTRSGLISVVVALALAFAFSFASSERSHSRRTVMVFAVPFVVALAAVVLPITTPGQRLIATIDPTQAVSTLQQSAQGTQRARELTWSTVIKWTNEDTARQVVGSGFGNDFLEESGTKAFLEGSTYNNVRSPHNWFVGIYARMGVIGLGLVAAVVLQLIFIMWRNRVRIGSDPLLSMCALIILSILPVATLGVVLEAPFGAVPFFWAAGVIMTLSGPVSAKYESGPPESLNGSIRVSGRPFTSP